MPYIITVLIAIVAGVGFTLFQANKSHTPIPKPTAITEPITQATATSSTFKDGVYTSKVTYLNPIKNEYALDVSLTVKDNLVTATAVTYSQGAEKDPNAQRFEGAYKTEVLGKSLENISLSRVGGASLTTNAFNEALIEIKTKAQS